MSDRFWQRFIISHIFEIIHFFMLFLQDPHHHYNNSLSNHFTFALRSTFIRRRSSNKNNEINFHSWMLHQMWRTNLYYMYVQDTCMYHVYNCVQLYHFWLLSFCSRDCCILKATISSDLTLNCHLYSPQVVTTHQNIRKTTNHYWEVGKSWVVLSPLYNKRPLKFLLKWINFIYTR